MTFAENAVLDPSHASPPHSSPALLCLLVTTTLFPRLGSLKGWKSALLEARAVVLAFRPAPSPLHPQLHHLRVTAAKTATGFQIPNRFFLLHQCQLQQSTSPWFLHHPCQEMHSGNLLDCLRPAGLSSTRTRAWECEASFTSLKKVWSTSSSSTEGGPLSHSKQEASPPPRLPTQSFLKSPCSPTAPSCCASHHHTSVVPVWSLSSHTEF